MSAKFVDALKGYEYFIDKRGNASLEDVNDFLKKNGRNFISQRTFTHYRSLIKYGFGSYFPINQFDVSRTLGQLPISPDRRRYKRELVEINAKISSDGSTWIIAKIIDKSLVGFGMETIQKFPLKPRNFIWVSINQYHNIPAILVWKKRNDNQMRFGVRAIKFIANYKMPKPKVIVPRLAGTLIIRKTSEEKITWGELYRIIGKIYELIAASSALMDEVARLSGLTEFQLGQPVLSSITFSSPFNINIKVDFNLAKILNTILSWCYLGKEIKDGFHLDNKEKQLKLEYMRHALKSKRETTKPAIPVELSSSLKEQIKDSLNIKELPSPLFDSGSTESGILNEQLIPAAIELVAGDNPDIEVEIKSDSDNHENMTKGKT